MTTFTPSTNAKAAISVDVRRRLHKINPNIYGGFTEHMGRCIYGGIYDPGNNLSDDNGFRKDVIDALKDLDVPVVRYPGGNFVATYHWEDGIGPKESRKSRPELAWLGTESNEFGTDEFMKWCKVVGTEPYLCLNFGTGNLDEALNWIEYCNGTRNTYYANLRRKNGHPEPYNVKYWGLGNEVWGPWQVNQMTKEAYAERAHQWGKAIKLLDPSVELILCGETGHSSWDHYVLQHAIEHITMHSIHIYTAATTHLPNVTAPLCAERSIQITSALIDLARIENNVPPSKPKPLICFDEWNVWDPERAVGSKGAEEHYSLSDALAVAVWLNVFVRQAQHLGMANIAQTVNVISPLMTTPDGIHKQTTWWPLLLFSKYMRGTTLNLHLECGRWEGDTQPGWIRGTLETPWLDASAAIDDDGTVNLAVVNISDEDDITAELRGLAGQAQIFTVNCDKEGDLLDPEGKGVGMEESTKELEQKFTFAKHSFTLLRWKP